MSYRLPGFIQKYEILREDTFTDEHWEEVVNYIHDNDLWAENGDPDWDAVIDTIEGASFKSSEDGTILYFPCVDDEKARSIVRREVMKRIDHAGGVIPCILYLDEDDWNTVVGLLEEPAKVIPGLREFLSMPDLWIDDIDH